MSAFAALNGFDGDEEDIVEDIKQKAREGAQQKEREAEASRLAFENFKAKAGTSTWGDDDDEDDLPVRSRAPARTQRPHSRQAQAPDPALLHLFCLPPECFVARLVCVPAAF